MLSRTSQWPSSRGPLGRLLSTTTGGLARTGNLLRPKSAHVNNTSSTSFFRRETPIKPFTAASFATDSGDGESEACFRGAPIPVALPALEPVEDDIDEEVSAPINDSDSFGTKSSQSSSSSAAFGSRHQKFASILSSNRPWGPVGSDAPYTYSSSRTDIAGKGNGSSFPRGPSSSAPYPPPSSIESFKAGPPRRGGASGGGGGRQRCPKCGTFVTFRHGDFEENTFYCASCSGWFAVSPDASPIPSFEGVHPSESPYDKFIANEAWSQKKHHLTALPEEQQQANQHARGRDFHNMRRSPGSAGANAEGGKQGGGKDRVSTSIGRMPTPQEIKRGLDEYVIGQSKVKMALSVGVYDHYKRIYVSEARAAAEAAKNGGVGEQENYFPVGGDGNRSGLSELNFGQYGREIISDSDGRIIGEKSTSGHANSIVDGESAVEVEDCEIDKSNIMLLGPTGSGKTHLVKTLARLIDVPLVIADATCLTQAGYVGEDVESILLKLYLESGQDLERCQKGIIFIDETDKIRKSGGNVSISRDVSGEGVQHALLKIVEGNVVNVPKEMGRKNPSKDFRQIDTTNILFICGGAYAGLERIVNRRMDVASIGFGAEMKKEIDDPKVQGKYFDNVIPKDLVDFGMIPEFVGRFPVIVSTKGLDLDNLVDILTEPKNSIMKQYKRLFAIDDVNLHVTDCGLRAIAQTAFSRGAGARGLRSIAEQILKEAQFVIPSMTDVHTCYVDAAAVRLERKPILLQGSMTIEKYEECLRKGQYEVDGAIPVSIEGDEETECDREEAA